MATKAGTPEPLKGLKRIQDHLQSIASTVTEEIHERSKIEHDWATAQSELQKVRLDRAERDKKIASLESELTTRGNKIAAMQESIKDTQRASSTRSGPNSSNSGRKKSPQPDGLARCVGT